MTFYPPAAAEFLVLRSMRPLAHHEATRLSSRWVLEQVKMFKRLLPLARTSRRTITTTKPARAGGGDSYHGYREAYYEPKIWLDHFSGKLVGGFFCWWILHNFRHDFGLLVGEFPYHSPRTEFTDEELGIPPDSEGLAPEIANVRDVHTGMALHGNDKYVGPYILAMYHDGNTGVFKM